MAAPFDPQTLEYLNSGERVAGTDPGGGFAYDLDFSVPCLVTAIHAGHQIRHELLPLLALSESGRLEEEDAATDRIVVNCPSTLWALDSRAEYDLNRPPELALPLTPEMFWGTRVYTTPPDEAMNRRSLEKYHAFYRFAAAVIRRLLDRFGACVVYDIHSYNIRRQAAKGHPSPPDFNLGTRGIDRARWEKPVTAWLKELGRIRLVEGQSVSVAENDVFSGLGEFCRRLTEWDPDILVLPTEISKFYMDEVSGVVSDKAVDCLAGQLATAVASHTARFLNEFCRRPA